MLFIALDHIGLNYFGLLCVASACAHCVALLCMLVFCIDAPVSRTGLASVCLFLLCLRLSCFALPCCGCVLLLCIALLCNLLGVAWLHFALLCVVWTRVALLVIACVFCAPFDVVSRCPSREHIDRLCAPTSPLQWSWINLQSIFNHIMFPWCFNGVQPQVYTCPHVPILSPHAMRDSEIILA